MRREGGGEVVSRDSSSSRTTPGEKERGWGCV